MAIGSQLNAAEDIIVPEEDFVITCGGQTVTFRASGLQPSAMYQVKYLYRISENPDVFSEIGGKTISGPLNPANDIETTITLGTLGGTTSYPAKVVLLKYDGANNPWVEKVRRVGYLVGNGT